MMTIKIISKFEGEIITFLFEVNNPRHKIVNYADYKDYCKKWGELTEAHNTPAFVAMCDVKENEGAGSLLAIHYNTNSDIGELRFIGARNAVVYIMHEGKTIDTIYC